MDAINAVLIAVVVVVVVAFLLFLIYRLVEAYRRQASAAREETPIIFLTNVFLFALYRWVRARPRQAPAAREDVSVTLLPITSLGKWSLGLAIAFIVLFVVAVVPLREQWGLENEEIVNPALTVVLTIFLVGIAVAALVTGFIGAIMRRERSLLVFLGMLVAFWFGMVGAVGEFLI